MRNRPHRMFRTLAGALLLISSASCGPPPKAKESRMPPADLPKKMETATFAAGCFWCVEAVFQSIDGVESVMSGYIGGSVPNPTYKQVCSGETGHAEATQITFDANRIAYPELLDWFWRMHDPTTPNRQGADVGTQYRSAIFTHAPLQQTQAEASRAALAKADPKLKPIVTEILPATTFYPAEDYHQDYFNNNASAPYCAMVIKPKLHKLKLD